MAKQKITYTGREEFESDLDRFVTLKLQLASAEAELNLKINELREQYKQKLDSLSTDIKPLQKKLANYALANQGTLLPGDKRSAETTLAEWGIRKTPDSVKTLPGWTWDRVTAELVRDQKVDFLNMNTSVNKSAVMTAMDDADKLRYGMCITSSEEFYITPRATK